MKFIPVDKAKQIIDQAGFSDAFPVDQLSGKDRLYAYHEDVGLFPISLLPRVTVIHAAIYRNARGKPSVDAAKSTIALLKTRGYPVVTKVQKDNRAAMIYAAHCGGKRAAIKSKFIYYRF